jgi:DNA ligase (NAD+)
MTKDEVLQRIEFLRKELNHHNYLYYVLVNPVLSDYEFDILLKELQELEKSNPEFFDANSPTQRVGNDINLEFSQRAHK